MVSESYFLQEMNFRQYWLVWDIEGNNATAYEEIRCEKKK